MCIHYIYTHIYTHVYLIYIYTIYNDYNSCIYNIIYIDTYTVYITLYIYISHLTFFWWIDVVQPAVFFCIHMYTLYIYTTYNYYDSCI